MTPFPDDSGPSYPLVALVAPSLEGVGGQAVQAHALTRLLKSEGYTVTFIATNPTFPRGFRWLRKYPYARTVLNEALYCAKLVRLSQADVVHVFSASYWSFLLAVVPPLLVGRALGKRVLVNYRSGEAENHLARWGLLVHPWLRLANEIVVPSEYLRTVFSRHGYTVRVIANVVDVSQFRFRERHHLRPHLLSNRNFETHYRVDKILEAFALLRRRYPSAILTVAGSGTLEPNLRRMAASIGGDGIRFVGSIDRAAMAALHDEADVLVNASVIDNQPSSVLEAFASGLPVVSTPTGDIANLVRDRESGFVVPPDDPLAMAGAIDELMKDPALVLRITGRARQAVERFTWPRVRGDWHAVYAGDGPGLCPDQQRSTS
jgi:L-malate glycosyltransferase